MWPRARRVRRAPGSFSGTKSRTARPRRRADTQEADCIVPKGSIRRRTGMSFRAGGPRQRALRRRSRRGNSRRAPQAPPRRRSGRKAYARSAEEGPTRRPKSPAVSRRTTRGQGYARARAPPPQAGKGQAARAYRLPTAQAPSVRATARAAAGCARFRVDLPRAFPYNKGMNPGLRTGLPCRFLPIFSN